MHCFAAFCSTVMHAIVHSEFFKVISSAVHTIQFEIFTNTVQLDVLGIDGCHVEMIQSHSVQLE